MCLGGVMARSYFSCEEKQIIMRMKIIYIYGNCYEFQSGKVKVTHSWFVA